MKRLEEPQVQAGVSTGPVNGLFINCSAVHTGLEYVERKEAHDCKLGAHYHSSLDQHGGPSD